MSFEEWLSIGILLLVAFVFLKIMFRLILSLIILIAISAGAYYDYNLYKESPKESYIFQYILTEEDTKQIDKKIEDLKETTVDSVKEEVIKSNIK